MSDITTGGLRDRLIRDAVAAVVRDGLVDLGWFNSDRRHMPFSWRDQAVGENELEVPLNTVACSMEETRDSEAELGSLLSEDRYEFWVDFYAENEDIGRHVIGDVRDILKGKHPSIGRTWPVVAVYDVTQDPVPAEPAFYVEVENVDVDRSRDTTRPFEQFWFACSFEIVDTR